MEESPQSLSVAPALIGCQGLEQFLLLAKTACGSSAVVQLICQTLDASGIYVFGELLDAECVKELSSSGQEGANYVQLLELFAYGTYGDYKANVSTLPPLTQPQLIKLKHLTIVSLAAKCTVISYSTLLRELDIQDLRILEDLIIDAIYAGVIRAKLDQNNARLEVESFIGRDIKMDTITGMIEKLESWSSNCGSVLQAMEDQMHRANQLKVNSLREREKHELEIKQLCQSIKVAANDGDDGVIKDFGLGDHMGPFSGRLHKKGLRGSAAHQGGRK